MDRTYFLVEISFARHDKCKQFALSGFGTPVLSLNDSQYCSDSTSPERTMRACDAFKKD